VKDRPTERMVIVAIAIATSIVLCGYLLAWLAICGADGFLTRYCWRIEEFAGFYAKNLRGSLFAGFLTLGGFLLSLKTFIIVNMKKEVYDTPEYKRTWDESKQLDSRVGSMYTPLRELSDRLYVAIFSCVMTAVFQFTFGLAESIWTALTCIWMAVLSIIFLLWCLHSIRANLTTMFGHLEAKATAEQLSKGAS